jgi:hypothetical protein
MPSLYEVLSKFVEEQKRDQDFLRQMGWRRCWGETCKIKGFTSLCNNVWMNPITGEKRPQVFSMAAHQCERAIDIAAEERLKELQWKEIIIRIHNGEEAVESRWWVHPETKRLFRHDDAVKMAKDYYNDEVIMCVMNNKINELLDGNRLNQGDLICIDTINGVYTLWD